MLLKDDIVSVELCRKPAFIKRGAKRGRRRQGVKYEEAVHEHFREIYAHRWIASPWLRYKLRGVGRWQFAQPDALLVDVDRGSVVVCEVKYQHTLDAYWQVMGKYVPLLERLFPKDLWQICPIEIVKWYDCQVPFPMEVKLRQDISEARVEEFGVHIWKP